MEIIYFKLKSKCPSIVVIEVVFFLIIYNMKFLLGEYFSLIHLLRLSMKWLKKKRRSILFWTLKVDYFLKPTKNKNNAYIFQSFSDSSFFFVLQVYHLNNSPLIVNSTELNLWSVVKLEKLKDYYYPKALVNLHNWIK